MNLASDATYVQLFALQEIIAVNVLNYVKTAAIANTAPQFV